MSKIKTEKINIHKTGRKRAVYLIYESLVRSTPSLELSKDRDSISSFTHSVLECFDLNIQSLFKSIEEKGSQKNHKLIPNIDLAIMLTALCEKQISDKLSKDAVKKIVECYIDLAKIFGAKDDSYKYIHAILLKIFK